MKIIKFIFSFLLTYLIIQALNKPLAKLPIIGNQVAGTSAEMLPALGNFLSPFHGFLQNAESIKPSFSSKITLPELQQPVDVVFDTRLVPHIFAENEADVHMVQGYITAQHRLWQMEFQTHAAAGRISEIIGQKGVKFDKQQRRLGMVWAAEKSLEKILKNTISRNALEAYTKGVNAYIESLNYKNLPIEYKLLGYEPETWTNLKSALLLKSMANDLTGYDRDVELSNAVKLLGKKTCKLLFPDFLDGQDPIIEKNTDWNFIPTKVLPPVDTSSKQQALITHDLLEKPDVDNGSNNWVVGGEKTASKAPILCNDPHLSLSLPSIWYEVQLVTPDMNVYGVSLPGAPSVIIGFNEKVSWGVTNASRDVKDWYAVVFKDTDRTSYKYNNTWAKTSQRVEVIKIKNQENPIVDTVLYTHLGPIVYENDTTKDRNNMALRWQAHDASNELLTFCNLNKAKNYADYLTALQSYECPAQNFVFADKGGTIAIWQQGKFPLKWKEQGKYVLEANNPSHEWQGYIPSEHNPHSVDPIRGFVSSTNQHPTDNKYPYYYSGNFEYYRNRRLNQQLTTLQDITVEDMKGLQLDNYNLKAAEVMPTLLTYLADIRLNPQEKSAFNKLKKWNFYNNPETPEATMFDIFWDRIRTNIWDEIANLEIEKEVSLPYPNSYVTTDLLTTQPDHKLMDIQKTESQETAADIIAMSFKEMVMTIQELKVSQPDIDNITSWANYKDSEIRHLARLAPFSLKNLNVGGGRNILNAMKKRHGPSWRMIVSLEDSTKAWGIYPGGQSGNPGSPYYSNFVDKWATGEYYRLLFWENAEQVDSNILSKQVFKN